MTTQYFSFIFLKGALSLKGIYWEDTEVTVISILKKLTWSQDIVQIGMMTSITGMHITLCKDMSLSANGNLIWQSTWKSSVSSVNSAPKLSLGSSLLCTEQPKVIKCSWLWLDSFSFAAGKRLYLKLVFIVCSCLKIQPYPFVYASASDYCITFCLTNTVLHY